MLPPSQSSILQNSEEIIELKLKTEDVHALKELWNAKYPDHSFDLTNCVSSIVHDYISNQLKNKEELKQKLLRDTFNNYISKWKNETGNMLVTNHIYENKWFLKTISLGTVIIPIILNDLQSDPTKYRFNQLLSTLTDKTPPKNLSYDQLIDFWLDYGKRMGYIKTYIPNNNKVKDF